MELAFKDRFIAMWDRYFPRAELPIAYAYTDAPRAAAPVPPAKGWCCFIGQLAKVRAGKSLDFTVDSLGCGKTHLGFSHQVRPDFEYFLSCGILGKMQGERYKQSPEIVRELIRQQPTLTAPAAHLIFKRWDRLDEVDEPAVVVFFATPDVLSGLFTLAGFDTADLIAVVAPFASGCGSIVKYPFLELASDRPRAILGLFDVSARPYVGANELTFAVLMPMFTRMVANAEESFLITKSWAKVRTRIRKRVAGSGLKRYP